MRPPSRACPTSSEPVVLQPDRPGFYPSYNSAVIPQHRPSASSRLWPARPGAICLPDACGLGCDSHGSKDFSGKLLEFLTQTGSKVIMGEISSSPTALPAPATPFLAFEAALNRFKKAFEEGRPRCQL